MIVIHPEIQVALVLLQPNIVIDDREDGPVDVLIHTHPMARILKNLNHSFSRCNVTPLSGKHHL
jgi:hypothetical protein